MIWSEWWWPYTVFGLILVAICLLHYENSTWNYGIYSRFHSCIIYMYCQAVYVNVWVFECVRVYVRSHCYCGLFVSGNCSKNIRHSDTYISVLVAYSSSFNVIYSILEVKSYWPTRRLHLYYVQYFRECRYLLWLTFFIPDLLVDWLNSTLNILI